MNNALAAAKRVLAVAQKHSAARLAALLEERHQQPKNPEQTEYEKGYSNGFMAGMNATCGVFKWDIDELDATALYEATNHQPPAKE